MTASPAQIAADALAEHINSMTHNFDEVIIVEETRNEFMPKPPLNWWKAIIKQTRNGRQAGVSVIISQRSLLLTRTKEHNARAIIAMANDGFDKLFATPA